MRLASRCDAWRWRWCCWPAPAACSPLPNPNPSSPANQLNGVGSPNQLPIGTPDPSALTATVRGSVAVAGPRRWAERRPGPARTRPGRRRAGSSRRAAAAVRAADGQDDGRARRAGRAAIAIEFLVDRGARFMVVGTSPSKRSVLADHDTRERSDRHTSSSTAATAAVSSGSARVVDRPAPGAVEPPASTPPDAWRAADLRFDRGARLVGDRGRRPRGPVEIAGLTARAAADRGRPGRAVPGARPDLAVAPGRRRGRAARPQRPATSSPTPARRRSPLAAGGARGDPRRRGAAGGRLGPAQRGAVRAGGPADPLDRRRRAGVRRAARPAAAAATTASSSTRPRYGHGAGGRPGSSPTALPDLLDAVRRRVTGPTAGVRPPDRAHAGLRAGPASPTSSRTRSGDLSRTSTRSALELRARSGAHLPLGAYAPA